MNMPLFELAFLMELAKYYAKSPKNIYEAGMTRKRRIPFGDTPLLA